MSVIYPDPDCLKDYQNSGGEIPAITAVLPLHYDGLTGTISETPASDTNFGFVTTLPQKFSGNKGFMDGIYIYDDTQSTGLGTGALIVDGGASFVKDVYIGGSMTCTTVTCEQYVGGALNIVNTTQSTSTDTGAVVIGGGLGIAKNLNCGQALSTKALYVANATASTNYATGSLIANGGCGIAGNINTLGTIGVASTTPSTSATTGALVVGGGAGFGGLVYAADVSVGTFGLIKAPIQHSKNVTNTVYSAMDFGCVGDGVTDDTANFLAFISACSSGAGHRGYIPAGTYRIVSDVMLDYRTGFTNGVGWTLYGDGSYQSTIAFDAGYRLIMTSDAAGSYGAALYDFGVTGNVNSGLISITSPTVTFRNTVLSSLHIKNSSSGTSACGINSDAVLYECVFEKLYINGNTGGTYGASALSFVYITSACSINDCSLLRYKWGIYFAGIAKSNEINSCDIWYTTQYSIYLTGSNVRHNIFCGVTFSNLTGNYIHLSGAISNKFSELTINSGTLGTLGDSNIIMSSNVNADYCAGMFNLPVANVTDTTETTSTSTGSLIVKGGCGIAKKLYVGNGISFGSGTAALSYYGTFSASITWSGALSVSITYYATRIGNVCTFHLPNYEGTATATDILTTVTGVDPAIRPSTIVYSPIKARYDSQDECGLFSMDTNGVLTIRPNITALSQKFLNGQDVKYCVNFSYLIV